MSRVRAQRPWAWRPKIAEDDVCLEVVSVGDPSGRKGSVVSSGGCLTRGRGRGRDCLLCVVVPMGEKMGLWEGERKGRESLAWNSDAEGRGRPAMMRLARIACSPAALRAGRVRQGKQCVHLHGRCQGPEVASDARSWRKLLC